ncbi:MAG TPA: hypothetical protein P5120_06875 [Spirochaetota bacterium]|nr:hypothetical protein [Spirochaetota bacterium]HPF07030.1 hypothetical protein [Spirochaetota bacterium]HPJ42283.1 hypothetical protein [Spirochaetota bacterium]HPR37008.1 hypothetical protein [Spirochaetota bacterium]HRX47224.1 hypothetical protein [Spirochaetota bacterium]
MKIMIRILLVLLILSPFAFVNAEAADYSGIWLVKYDRYQIVVTGSGDNYSFKKISFYRGKRHEHTGTFTVSGNSLRIQYSAGQKASARIKSPTHFVESSTVNWEKVSDSTNYPVFNITGTWKHFNSQMIIKQEGSSVTGVKYFNGKEYSRYSGEVEGYLLRLKEEFAGTMRPMEHSLLILDNDRVAVSFDRSSRANLWTKTGASADIPAEKKEQTAVKPVSFKVGGNWVINGIKSNVRITENKAGIFFNTSFTLNGKDVRWVGSGKLNGDKLEIKYRYTKNKPAGFENGTMHLEVKSKDLIEGKWVSDSGKYSDRIIFKRK